MSVVVLAVIKATAILVVALAASRIAWRTRAAIRHAVLAVGFAGLLLLPVAMMLLPEVPVKVPVAPAVMSIETILPALSVDPPAVSTSTPWSAARSSAIAWNVSIDTIVITLWAAGALIAVLPLGASAGALRRIRCQGTSFAEGQALLNELAVDFGVRPSIAIVIHAEIVGPMTCGVLRPIVVFPPDAREWRRPIYAARCVMSSSTYVGPIA
jgi:beta-lactamase regulating signal transducer with metallopeptidase domain